VRGNLEELLRLGESITVEVLLETGVGKPVHKLLTSSSRDEVARVSAQKLVNRWKKLIAQEDLTRANRPITPETPAASASRPNYEAMLSPALRKELQRFGLKVIPRQKAVPLLGHIYDETHPDPAKKKRKQAVVKKPVLQLSQPAVSNDKKAAAAVSRKNKVAEIVCFTQPAVASKVAITPPKLSRNSSSCSSQNSQDDEDLPEESMMCLSQGATAEAERQTANDVTIDLHRDVIKFIQNDAELHRMCLSYEPIWLEQFFDRFKAQSGLKKLKVNQIMDVLDNECITFRTAKSSRRNRK